MKLFVDIFRGTTRDGYSFVVINDEGWQYPMLTEAHQHFLDIKAIVPELGEVWNESSQNLHAANVGSDPEVYEPTTSSASARATIEISDQVAEMLVSYGREVDIHVAPGRRRK